jgi:hypothetical protein
MVELENGDRAIEIERDVLELHCFLMTCVYALFRCAEDRMSRPIFDFPGALVHACSRTSARHWAHDLPPPQQMETPNEHL